MVLTRLKNLIQAALRIDIQVDKANLENRC